MFGLSAIECFVAIIVIYIVVYWITPRKRAWFPMALLVVLLSWLAFKVEPNETDDLGRYFMQLDYLRDYGRDYLQRCFDEGINSWDTYRVCGYYFYYISKLDDNHWLPSITIFIVYSLMFLVIYKAANRFNVDKAKLFFGTLFFLSTYWYYDTLAGVRNGLAFAVVFACAYYHLVERKFIPLCLAGYVLACLTHSAAVMPVALVILTIITLNTSGKVLKYGLIFGLASGGILIDYLATISDNSFIQSIAGRAEDHAAGSVLETDTSFMVNIATFVIVAIIIFYLNLYIIESGYSKDLNRFLKYSSIIAYFTLGAIYSGLIFVRFARWLLPIIGTLIYMIGVQMQSNVIEEKGVSYLKYYAPANHSMRLNIKPVFNFIFFAYTGVHFWYLCSGSSLSWMHF